MKLEPKCECGSRAFRSNDSVMCASGISNILVCDDGTLAFEFGGESETFWDTTAAVNEDKPNECAECQKGYSDADLIAAHAPECDDEAAS